MQLSAQVFGSGRQATSKADFGANVLFWWQNIGDSHGHFVVDEIVEKSGISYLRYPGGGVTETQFDINNPNAAFLDSDGDGVQDPGEKHLLPQDRFLEYCGSNGIEAGIVLPTSGPRVDITYDPSAGTMFNVTVELEEAYFSDFRLYIFNLLEDAHRFGTVIKNFELGNEFYGVDFDVHYHGDITGITKAVPYGAISDRMIGILSEELVAYKERHSLGDDWQQPDIAIQSVAPNSHLLDAGAEAWVGDVIQAQLSAESLAALDAVVAHYYFFDVEELSDIPDNIAAGAILMDDWDLAAGKELNRYVTEWNIDPFNSEFGGLKQVAPVLQIFSEFQRMDVEGMIFWPMEHSFGQLAVYDNGNDADLTLIGQFYSMMIRDLSGTTVLDLHTTSDAGTINGFLGEASARIFYVSTSDTTQGFSFDPNFFGNTLKDVSVYSEQSVPDLDFVQLETVELGNLSSSVSISLDSFEVLSLEVPFEQLGTEEDDVIVDSAFSNFLSSGAGDDILMVRSGLNRVLTGAGDDTVEGNTDLGGLIAVEPLSGARQSTGIFVDAGSGNDRIFSGAFRLNAQGGDGNDRLFGGAAQDTLDGGAGDDLIIGGSGNDKLVAGTGNDLLSGGNGSDEFLFSPFDGSNVIADANDGTSGVANALSTYDLQNLLNDYRYQMGRDFQPGEDKLSFQSFQLSAQEILDRFYDTDVGATFFYRNTKVVLSGVSASELSISDIRTFEGINYGRAFAVDIVDQDGWSYYFAEDGAEDFIFGPEEDGSTRFKETVWDFNLFGGDMLIFEGAHLNSHNDLVVNQILFNGRSGVEINYGNGSVFLPDHNTYEIELMLSSMIDFVFS